MSDYQETRGQVVLVDEDDEVLGVGDKLQSHQNGGRLHRAFSIFIFDTARRMLLQQRAQGKYHFAGLWTNACCSHPQPGETLETAACARLGYESGFQTSLQAIGSFIYQAHDTRSGLSEYEIDHIFSGEFNGQPQPNAQEIGDWKWASFDEIAVDLARHPYLYTPWFPIALQYVAPHCLNRAGGEPARAEVR